MRKIYEFDNNLQYGFDISSRKWKFIAKNGEKRFTFLYPARGVLSAQKICSHISGGIKRNFTRTGELGLDNLSRKNIEMVVGI